MNGSSFQMTCHLKGLEAIGLAKNKQEAKRLAAQNMLQLLRIDV
jgi:dsRNA-specific ribonuclease